MATDLTRRKFIRASAGIALGGPIAALGARVAEGHVRRTAGYGALLPTPEQDTCKEVLRLPQGFRHRINTKLVVDRGSRRVVESFAVLGGTHTNCAGGVTPWETWITCEEIFNYGSVESNTAPGTGVPHGYCFEVPAGAGRTVDAVPIVAAGRFPHEAVAVLDGVLYETQDRGDAAFYRFVPDRRPREWGDLATFGGTLQALKLRDRPNFDMDTAIPGEETGGRPRRLTASRVGDVSARLSCPTVV